MTYIMLFILGLAVGSFVNVVIDRLPKGISIWKGRSYCDFCHHKLSWLDLIPVFSFFILGRICRYCSKKISWQYPLVELTTGILFLLTFKWVEKSIEPNSIMPTFIYLLTVFSALAAVFFIDLKYRIIPDPLVVMLASLSLFFALIYNRSNLANFLLSGLGMFFVFLAIFLITSGRGMGFGDVKLSIFMGFFLGFPKIVVAFYLSFLTGAIISLILIIVGRYKMKDSVPFGPFLVTATFVSFFYGESLWRLFKGFIGI